MYFHDTNNKTNGHAAAPDPANFNNNYHHYNNNINHRHHHPNDVHYCNDAPAAPAAPPLGQYVDANDRRMSQRQSANQAYIQKSVLNRQTGTSAGMGYGGAMDSCNTEATLLPDYRE